MTIRGATLQTQNGEIYLNAKDAARLARHLEGDEMGWFSWWDEEYDKRRYVNLRFVPFVQILGGGPDANNG